MWTHFMDMHSGGYLKEKQQHIFIEAPEEEAKLIFFNRLGHSPERVSCTCCGEDYSISEYPTLEQATGYERGCAWEEDDSDEGGHYVERSSERKEDHFYRTLDQYLQSGEALVIYASDVKSEEREGTIPQQGYVWLD